MLAVSNVAANSFSVGAGDLYADAACVVDVCCCCRCVSKALMLYILRRQRKFIALT